MNYFKLAEEICHKTFEKPLVCYWCGEKVERLLPYRDTGICPCCAEGLADEDNDTEECEESEE